MSNTFIFPIKNKSIKKIGIALLQTSQTEMVSEIALRRDL